MFVNNYHLLNNILRNIYMIRSVLAIPLEEINLQFKENTRQDIKIIVPKILDSKQFEILKAKGKEIKSEQPLEGTIWKHSNSEQSNNICESKDFYDIDLLKNYDGPFALSFANEKAEQDEHYHKNHLEIYYSEYEICAEYRILEEYKTISLKNGGLIIFAPNVTHKMQLNGITIVIEVPASSNDKF